MHAYQQELQNCLPDLWRYAYALCRNADTADDLVQDCAERALRKRRLWRPTGPLKPWLIKMIRNIYLNDLRARRARPNTITMDQMTNQPIAVDALSDRLALSETARALSALQEDQRDVLLLIVVGGLSYKDAAISLDIPLGTLMSRLGRARSKLREVTSQDAKEGVQ